MAPLVEHWDFDLGGPLFDGGPVSCIDAGDIQTTMHDNAGNRARIEAKTREVLELPAIPILLGGDCSVTFPFLAGFADQGPVWVLQIDAHIDWRDEVHGERYGYSSPMRRASEMHRRAVGPDRRAHSRQCSRRHRPARLKPCFLWQQAVHDAMRFRF